MLETLNCGSLMRKRMIDPSAAGTKDVNLANLVGRIKKLVILS
jgi:hypothetical protein